jgi:hypothetical protein
MKLLVIVIWRGSTSTEFKVARKQMRCLTTAKKPRGPLLQAVIQQPVMCAGDWIRPCARRAPLASRLSAPYLATS